MSKVCELSGQVISGRGRAASIIRENIKELKEKTGEDLIEGSLNLILMRPLMLSNDNALKFANGDGLLWRASLNGVAVYIFRWEDMPLHIVEVLSCMHLRNSLRLKDGDIVNIVIQNSDLDTIPPAGKLMWNLCYLGRRHWYYTNDKYAYFTTKLCEDFNGTQKKSNKTLTHIIKSYIQKKNIYWFERIPIDPLDDTETQSFRRIQNILNYTKISGSAYSAHRYPAGYHTIEINGHRLEGQRDPMKRLEAIPIDFKGKTVLDIGCNQGGMLHPLDGEIKWGVGIDYDYRMINASNRIKVLRQSTNLYFYVFDLEKEPLDLIEDLLPEPKVDIVFLLAMCIWIKNWQEVVEFGARISDSMLFEATGTKEHQSAQRGCLDSLYGCVLLLSETSEDDPGNKQRQLFYCTKPRVLSAE
jgi:2-polyprenyl-3-methyl-5-hydroxy-6-metoxy-1,4-benzoquinol methylase